jgi:hypothetical protein
MDEVANCNVCIRNPFYDTNGFFHPGTTNNYTLCNPMFKNATEKLIQNFPLH